MSKHTPGPWKSNKIGYIYGHDVVVAVVGTYGAKDMLEFCKDRWDADTRLIAAAPELLDECEAARAIFAAYLSAGHNSPGPTPEDIDAAFWRLDALLNKIEGGTP
jgi:hypothetical protein